MGKVHGGLARAGRVRNATPKVEKTAKRRERRGRAYKRKLYNRRFLDANAVPLGKKRRYNHAVEEKDGAKP